MISTSGKILSFFFLMLILAVSAKDLIVYAQFKIDQDFIAKVLCINKDKPAMQCDGKCYLMQKLKKNNTEDQQDLPINIDDRRTINLFFNPIASFSTLDFKQSNEIDFNATLYDEVAIFEFFHPPELMA